MYKVTIPHNAANKLMKEGKFGEVMQKAMAQIKPEAAYFTAEQGKRCAIFIVNMENANEMIRLAEPVFHAFEADVELKPVMSAEELESGAHYIEHAVKNF